MANNRSNEPRLIWQDHEDRIDYLEKRDAKFEEFCLKVDRLVSSQTWLNRTLWGIAIGVIVKLTLGI